MNIISSRRNNGAFVFNQGNVSRDDLHCRDSRGVIYGKVCLGGFNEFRSWRRIRQ
jgi:hypothetical protein